MQTLWLYLDEIAGKGVGFLLMMELLGYMSVSMIPMALPIAVLISSVMVLGNLAEHYELSSIKSAGVPLIRVMRPLIATTFIIGIFSFFCSNNFIPVSNLKFKSRLYDIRKQKPTLNLEAGIFNDDFQGYAIRMAHKENDNKTIRDVLIIDHTNASSGKLVEISAKTGEMYVTEDEQFFVMRLYDGWQYQETKSASENYPFVRTSFKEWNKVFDLSEFKLDRTDERLFKSHYSMLTAGQLLLAIDSVDTDLDNRFRKINENNRTYFHPYKQIILKKRAEERKEKNDDEYAKKVEEKAKNASPDILELIKRDSIEASEAMKEKLKKQTNVKPQTTNTGRTRPINQINLEVLDSLDSFIETVPNYKRTGLYSRSKTFARTIHSQTKNALNSVQRRKETRVDYVFEFNNKFSMAVACILFLFIGAPMGAIVRKGGFGYPLLIAIVFFIFFMVLTIMSKNVAERFVIDAVLAAWIPCLVLFPLGLLLTYFAMNQHKITKPTKLLKQFERVWWIIRWVLRLVGLNV